MSRLKAWVPVLVWAVFMSGLSTDSFSSTQTSRIILPFLRWLLPHANDATLDLLHLVIRKTAHVVEYFILSLLLLRALRGPERGWSIRWGLAALLIAIAYACLDEFHQSFVPSRTASGLDVLRDTIGAAVAQGAAWIYARRQNRSVGADKGS